MPKKSSVIQDDQLKKLLPRETKVADGIIKDVLRYKVGAVMVTFKPDNENREYGSQWPEWAFQTALEALLHNKKVRVGFEDKPMAQNLLFVGIIA